MKHLLLAASLLASGPGLGARAPEAIPVARNLSRPAGSRTLLASVDPGLLSAAPPIEAALPSVLAFPGGIGIPKVITWASTAGDSGIAWGTTSQITAANAYITYNTAGGGMSLFSPGFGIFGESIDSATDTAYFQANTGIGTNLTSVILSVTGGHGSFPAESLTVQTNGLIALGNLSFVAGVAGAASTYNISQNGSNLILNAPSSKGFQFWTNGSLTCAINAGGTLACGGYDNAGASYSGGGGAGAGALIQGNENSGATAIAITLNSVNTLTAGQLLSVQNGTAPKFTVGSSGTLGLVSGNAPNAAIAGISYDGTNMDLNVPSGKGFQFSSAGTPEVIVRPTSGLAFSNTAVPATTDAGIGSGAGTGDVIVNATTGRSIFLRLAGTNAGLAESAGAPVGAQLQFEISHIAGGSGVPTSATAGGGCGTSSAANVTGNDLMGTLGVTCGTAGTGATTIVSATFAHAYVTNAPVCSFTCANAATCALALADVAFNNSTTSTLSIESNATAPTGTLLWSYVCSQR